MSEEQVLPFVPIDSVNGMTQTEDDLSHLSYLQYAGFYREMGMEVPMAYFEWMDNAARVCEKWRAK